MKNIYANDTTTGKIYFSGHIFKLLQRQKLQFPYMKDFYVLDDYNFSAMCSN